MKNFAAIDFETANECRSSVCSVGVGDGPEYRPGYLDQTKRFNVRQAIDQQEISSFFDMVKAED